MRPPLAYSPYSPLTTYTPSLAYPRYLPLATYMLLAVYTLSLACLHAFFGILAVLNLGIFAPLIVALGGTVIIASCKQQHEILIVAWKSYSSFPCILCLSSSLLAIQPRNDCCVITIVVVASWSISSLVSCTFAIVDVFHPHQWTVCCCCAILKSLVAINCCCHH